MSPTTTKVARQPQISATKVPMGTPTISATLNPAKMAAVALVTISLGTSDGASAMASDQKPPRPKPNRQRENSIQPYSVATAEMPQATTSSEHNASTAVRRFRLPASNNTQGAPSAASRPGMVSIRPASPVEIPKLLAMAGNTPTGINSAVT